MPYNSAADRFHTKKLYSRLSSSEVRFYTFYTWSKLPASLLQRLQSVQNFAARLIYRLGRSGHITDALLSLHWLRVRERVVYKVAVLTYKALSGLAQPYLSSAFTHVADVASRRRLPSASTNQLLVPSYRRSMIGRRAWRSCLERSSI